MKNEPTYAIRGFRPYTTHGRTHHFTCRTSTIQMIVASETAATPPVNTTYELVQRLLLMGSTQFHINPTIMPSAPTANSALTRSSKGRSCLTIQRPARLPIRQVA